MNYISFPRSWKILLADKGLGKFIFKNKASNLEAFSCQGCVKNKIFGLILEEKFELFCP